jgi:hypothetical protein
MAIHSRWDDIKNKRPAPSNGTRVEVEHELALGRLIYDLRTPAFLPARIEPGSSSNTISGGPDRKGSVLHRR